MRAWTDPHQVRAARGEKHPVYDFLFNYYAFRPAWLRRWHPGPDVALAGESARGHLRWSEYHALLLADGVVTRVRGAQAPTSFGPSTREGARSNGIGAEQLQRLKRICDQKVN